MYILFFIFLFAITSKLSHGSDQYLWDVSGVVPKGNFSYYSMTYDGTILLQLISTSGDCDLYVSQNTLKPSYYPESYCLQSMTCGEDIVIVPKSFKRPVGIGVFGHPAHEICVYYLKFYRIHDSQDIFHYDPYVDTSRTLNQKQTDDDGESDSNSDDDDEEEETFFWEKESFFWTLFRYIIECLIDVFIF